jgi:hypothetical protein
VYLCIRVSVLRLILIFIRFLYVKNVMQSNFNFLEHELSAVFCMGSNLAIGVRILMCLSVFQSQICTFASFELFIYRNRKFMVTESSRWGVEYIAARR